MQKVIFVVDANDVDTLMGITKPYLARVTVRKKNRRTSLVIIESGLLTQLGIRYELRKAGVKNIK